MPDTPKVFVVSPDGEEGYLSPTDAQGAIDAGYRQGTPEEQQHHENKKKFDTTGQQIATGVEGAADALTLGGSTFLERGLGVPAEDIAGRAEENPVSHGIGTAVGIAAPLVLTAGAAAAPEAIAEGGLGVAKGIAELSAPSLITKAGQAVTKAVGLGLEGQATSALGRIGTKALAVGAGGALEGGLYGVGNVVHEAALGDPHLTAQSALAEIGLSAALGGGLAASGGVLSGVAKEATSGDLGAKLADWLGTFEGERNIKAAGAVQGDITRTGKQIGRERLNSIGKEMGELGLVGPFSTPVQTLERAQGLMQKAGGEMGDILRAADASATKAAPEIESIVAKAREAIEPLSQNPLQKEAASKLTAALDGYEAKFTAQPLTFESAHAMRREISEALYGMRGNMDPFANAFKEGLHDLRTIVSDEINSSLEKSGASSAAWKQANRLYEVASKASDFAEKGIARSHGNNLVSPTELLGLLAGGVSHGIPGASLAGVATAAARRYGAGVLGAGARGVRKFLEAGAAEGLAAKTAELISSEKSMGADIVARAASPAQETAAALSNLQQANQAVANRIEHAASVIVRGAESAGRVGRAEAAAGIHSIFGKSTEAARPVYEKRAEKVRELGQNPELLYEKLTHQVADVQEHAPETAQAIQTTSARGVAFLASKLPHAAPSGPLQPKRVTSQSDMSKFNRYYEAVENPTSVLKQAAAGTLTPEAVEAVKTVYPQLYQQMTKSILDKLASQRGPVPHRSRLMLGLLLGQDLDGSLRPESVLRNQATFQGPSSRAPQSSLGPGPATANSKLTIANRSLTPMQQAQARGDD